MDPQTQSMVILIAAVGSQVILIVGAIFTGWAALSARRIANDTKVETAIQTTKIDQVATDTAVVLGHVNSKETKLTAMVESQQREMQMLRDQLVEKDKVAAVLAAGQATLRSVIDRVPPARSLNGRVGDPVADTAIAKRPEGT